MSVHPSRDTLPAALVFPVGQAVHETVPSLSENEPGSHFWHVAEPNAEATVPGSHKGTGDAKRHISGNDDDRWILFTERQRAKTYVLKIKGGR